MEAESESSHPLQKWMTVDEFAIIIKANVECDNGTDLSKLAIEEHVEIHLNTDVTFHNPARDVRRHEWFSEQSCVYRFHFRGVQSGINIKFSAKPSDPHCRTVRDLLLSCLAEQCQIIQRLSIHGYCVKSDETCGFMGDFETFDRRLGGAGVFSSWADSHAVLRAFANAGYWKDSLQELDLLNHAAFIAPDFLPFLASLPKNLSSMRVAHLPWEKEQTINRLLGFFPTLKRLHVSCSNQFGVHYISFQFRLWKFLAGLHHNNPNLQSLQVVWNAVASVSAGVTEEQRASCLQALRSLARLKHLTVGPNVWDGTRDTKALAHGILRMLPDTNIKELRLQTIPVLKECLYEQLSRKDCRLDLFDVTPYGIGRRRDIPLTALSSFAKNVHMPAQGDGEALDFVFLLRRFRGVLSWDCNRLAPLWPLLLATAGNWQVGKGMSMPRNRRGEPTHWLTDKGTTQPPPRGGCGGHGNLTRSLFYALLRERADVACSGLQSKKEPNRKSTKRAAEEPLCSKKRSKRPTSTKVSMGVG